MLLLSFATWFVLHRISETPMAVPARHAKSDLKHLTQNLVDVCRTYHQQTVSKLESGLTVLQAAGPIRLDPDRYLVWRAKNETTGEFKSLQLPLLVAGAVQFEPVRDFADPAPMVDAIEKISGTPATIFQRVDELGNMLRVASSVRSEDGKRDIGSFIPAAGNDGAVIQPMRSVLAGEPYVAKSLSHKTTYLTAYQPIKNRAGRVVGMLATALPENRIATQVRNVAVNSMPPDRNDFFAFEASGERRGTVQIMADKSLEGRDLWSEKDSSGRVYVQELCRRALSLASGEVAEYRYAKTTRAGGLPQLMNAHFAYVKELDWAVGFAQPERESLAGVSPLQAAVAWAMWLLLGVSAASTGLAVRVWIHVSDDMAAKLTAVLSHLTKDAKQLSATALAQQDNEAVEDLQRQARHLILLAEGIDQTVKTINEDRGVRP